MALDEIQSLLKEFDEMKKALEEAEIEVKEKTVELSRSNKELADKVGELENTKKAVLNVLEDLTKRTAELRLSEERLNLSLKSAEMGWWDLDLVNDTAKRNLRHDEIFGYKTLQPNWGAKIFGEHVVPEDRAYATHCFDAAFKTGDLNMQCRVKWPDGSIHWIDARGQVFYEDKKPVRMHGTVADITPQKEAEGKLVAEKESVERKVTERTRELKEEQARLVASINSLDFGFIIADASHQIVLKNKAISNILGISDGVATMAEIDSLFGKSVDVLGKSNLCLAENLGINVPEVIFGNKFLRFFFSPIVMIRDHKEVIGYVFLLEDITEAKLLERSREEFFAIASHEMRTPLTAIRGNMALIKDFFGTELKNPDVKEMVDDSYKASIRLIGIVNDFLDTSRLEQGKLSLKSENINLVALTTEVVHELNAMAESKKLKLNFKTDDAIQLPPVSADRDRAKQVIYNLVSNAINYTQEGGINIDITKEGNFLKVSVADTGNGISPQNQSLLFKKFQQAGEKILTRDVSKSTGLGLYISKLLVGGMGGKIWLEKSELGKGSTFAFTLPLVS
ncbi:MAG: ATP-binding protein [Patescibacteria group bacterium]